jgi:hypothetical protein
MLKKGRDPVNVVACPPRPSWFKIRLQLGTLCNTGTGFVRRNVVVIVEKISR